MTSRARKAEHRRIRNARVWEAFHRLSQVEPVVTVEPEGITNYSVEYVAKWGGPLEIAVTPPELERVTATYDNGQDKLVMVIYDRERAAEAMKFWDRADARF